MLTDEQRAELKKAQNTASIQSWLCFDDMGARVAHNKPRQSFDKPINVLVNDLKNEMTANQTSPEFIVAQLYRLCEAAYPDASNTAADMKLIELLQQPKANERALHLHRQAQDRKHERGRKTLESFLVTMAQQFDMETMKKIHDAYRAPFHQTDSQTSYPNAQARTHLREVVMHRYIEPASRGIKPGMIDAVARTASSSSAAVKKMGVGLKTAAGDLMTRIRHIFHRSPPASH